jgi:hypothetical protein
MTSKKPIRVFCTDITGHYEFYASQHYKELTDDDGNVTGYLITGAKYNVTQDIAAAIVKNDIEFTRADTSEQVSS